MISIVVVVVGGGGGDGGGGFVYTRQRGEASERGEGGSSARVAPLYNPNQFQKITRHSLRKWREGVILQGEKIWTSSAVK
jgi:hypothetical protein